MLDVDDLHAELMLIDENLCRNDLSPAERAVAQARRKAIYQQIHPETKAGASGKYRPKSQFGQVGQAENHPAPRYDEAAAEATGQSERAVRRDVTRGEALGEDVLAKVARTSLDKGEELDALAKLSPDHRNVLIARAASGEKVSAKVEVKKEHRAARERGSSAHGRLRHRMESSASLSKTTSGIMSPGRSRDAIARRRTIIPSAATPTPRRKSYGGLKTALLVQPMTACVFNGRRYSISPLRSTCCGCAASNTNPATHGERTRSASAIGVVKSTKFS